MRQKYAQTFRNHVTPHIGHIYLKELTHEPLRYLFKTTLKEKKKLKNGVETNVPLLGANARLNIYKQLRSALIKAKDLQLIKVNPLKLVTAPTYEPPTENIPHMMNVVLGMFMKMDELNDPARNHFLLALLGLRRGERLGLAFSDLKLNTTRPTMTIRHQLKRVTGEGLHISNATKTGKSRTISIPEPFFTHLKEQQQYRKVQKKMPGFKPEPEFADLVFLHDNGKPYDPNEDNNWWNEINKKYNPRTTHIRGHALRHIAATYMADQHIDADIVRAVLGHESEAMGYYYMRISANKQQPQLQRMGEGLTARITSTKK
jgi:integrase